MKARDSQPPEPRARRAPSTRRRGPRARPSIQRQEWGLDARPAAQPMTMQTLRGIAVSPGIAIGPVVVLDHRGHRVSRRTIQAESVAAELERLDCGLESARGEAEVAETEARDRLGLQYAAILAAHARMIADPTLRRDARLRVERDLVAAEEAVSEVLEGHANRLESLTDSHLAARAADVRDIQHRILGQLLGQRPTRVMDMLHEPTVVLAHDLSPSETAGLDPERVLGFATEAGGRASHTAIVAAALEIPAVVGLGRFLDRARPCRMVIIDGDEGLVVLDPDPPTQERATAAPPSSGPPGSKAWPGWPTSPPRPSTGSRSGSGVTSSSPARSPPASSGVPSASACTGPNFSTSAPSGRRPSRSSSRLMPPSSGRCRAIR